jgi:hypothetical protein
MFALGVIALWMGGYISVPESFKQYRYNIHNLDSREKTHDRDTQLLCHQNDAQDRANPAPHGIDFAPFADGLPHRTYAVVNLATTGLVSRFPVVLSLYQSDRPCLFSSRHMVVLFLDTFGYKRQFLKHPLAAFLARVSFYLVWFCLFSSEVIWGWLNPWHITYEKRKNTYIIYITKKNTQNFGGSGPT